MPSLKTECTELAVAFGLLNLSIETDYPYALVAKQFNGTLSEPKYQRFVQALAESQESSLYRSLHKVGITLRAKYPLFASLSEVQWTGPRRQASTLSVAKDLMAANTPISVKASSNLVMNASPFNIFENLPRGVLPAQRSKNWYGEQDPEGYQRLWEFVRSSSRLAVPASVDEFDRSSRQSGRRIVQAAIHAMGEPERSRFNELYTSLGLKVAQRSAALFAQNIQTSLQGTLRCAVLEQIARWFFRMDAVEYVLCGLDYGRPFAVAVPDLTSWRTDWKIIEVAPAADSARKQSVVEIKIRCEHKREKLQVVIPFHIEIRWSHGKFCGAPEAKLYKDFLWTELPFFKSLV